MSERYFKLIEDLKLLSKRFDLPISVESSDRLFGAKDDFEDILSDCEVIIRQIPNEINEIQLIPLFARYGDIYSFRLKLNNNVLSHNKLAYCTYKNRIAAQNCLMALNDYEILRGKRIKIKRTMVNCTLFIGNICPEKTKEEILYALIKAGLIGIRDIVTYKSCSNPEKKKAYAFVPFYTHELAKHAKFYYGKKLVLFGENVSLHWASSIPDADDKYLEHIDKLLLRNLSVNQSRIPFGEDIRKVLSPKSIARLCKNKDDAFIRFNTREEAIIAKMALEEYYAGTEVEVTLGAPLELLEKFGTSCAEEEEKPNILQQLRARFENFWLKSDKNVLIYGQSATIEEWKCNCLLPHYDHFDVYLRMVSSSARMKCTCRRTMEVVRKILHSLNLDHI